MRPGLRLSISLQGEEYISLQLCRRDQEKLTRRAEHRLQESHERCGRGESDVPSPPAELYFRRTRKRGVAPGLTSIHSVAARTAKATVSDWDSGILHRSLNTASQQKPICLFLTLSSVSCKVWSKRPQYAPRGASHNFKNS